METHAVKPAKWPRSWSTWARALALICAAAVLLPIARHSSGKDKPPTAAQVEKLIKQAGRTPPKWWDDVRLSYPKTLDLSWPEPTGEWNTAKNLDQYLFSVVGSDPKKWREGIKLLHHVMEVNKGDSVIERRCRREIGALYSYIGDWARAAYYWRQSGDKPLGLAECYWKLGSKALARQALSKMESDETRNGTVIRLWAQLGELTKALRLAGAKARAGMPDVAYLAVANGCRRAGRYENAVLFYRRVIAARRGGPDIKRNKERARASIDAVTDLDGVDLAREKDGANKGRSHAFRGPLSVEVKVKGGRILSVRIAKHREGRVLSAFKDVPKQIVEKQGIAGVDAVTGATVTSEAIINAAAKALKSGMK